MAHVCFGILFTMNSCQLKNKSNTLIAEILPEHAGSINRLSVLREGQMVDIVDGYVSEEELIANEGSKSSFLAPFPNRTRDGKFTFNEREYQFPINKPKENNAIHGFLQKKKFTVTTSSQEEIGLSYQYNGEKDYFPFPFSVAIKYQIDGDELTCVTEIKNIGAEEMPFGFGWHPYFKIGETIDKLMLRIPSCGQIEVDDRLLPIERISNYSSFQDVQPIGATSFDTGFVVSDTERETVLFNKKFGLQITVKNGEGFDYLQIYTPPDRKTIAIEPMTCAADALNTKMGLKVLAPNESFSAIYSIKVEQDCARHESEITSNHN